MPRSNVSIALVGCGRWGQNLARALHGLGALAVIVDPTDFAAKLAQSLGVSYLPSPEALWGDPAISAVVIATPAETHVTVGLAALQAGKHIYVEKPIALSIAEARELGSAADAAGLTLMVGHLLQYHPAYRKLAQIAQAGELGAIRHVISSRMNLGVVRNEENVLWSFSPHDISMALGLTKAPASRARASGNAFITPGIEDVVTLQVEFTDGMTAEIRSSWVHPEKEQKLVVVGEAGLAVFDDRAAWPGKLVVTGYSIDRANPRPLAVRGEERAIALDEGEPLRLEMAHFIDCVRTGNRPLTDAAEATAVLALLEAGQQSLAANGAWIHV